MDSDIIVMPAKNGLQKQIKKEFLRSKFFLITWTEYLIANYKYGAVLIKRNYAGL
jgi:hypothetical protein